LTCKERLQIISFGIVKGRRNMGRGEFKAEIIEYRKERRGGRRRGDIGGNPLFGH